MMHKWDLIILIPEIPENKMIEVLNWENRVEGNINFEVYIDDD